MRKKSEFFKKMIFQNVILRKQEYNFRQISTTAETRAQRARKMIFEIFDFVVIKKNRI